jgi:hypothetical protein
MCLNVYKAVQVGSRGKVAGVWWIRSRQCGREVACGLVEVGKTRGGVACFFVDTEEVALRRLRRERSSRAQFVGQSFVVVISCDEVMEEGCGTGTYVVVEWDPQTDCELWLRRCGEGCYIEDKDTNLGLMVSFPATILFQGALY